MFHYVDSKDVQSAIALFYAYAAIVRNRLNEGGVKEIVISIIFIKIWVLSFITKVTVSVVASNLFKIGIFLVASEIENRATVIPGFNALAF